MRYLHVFVVGYSVLVFGGTFIYIAAVLATKKRCRMQGVSPCSGPVEHCVVWSDAGVDWVDVWMCESHQQQHLTEFHSSGRTPG